MNIDLSAAQDFHSRTLEARSTLVFHHQGRCAATVSIVIPTFRRDDLLAQALASALAQDACPPYEIIIVDNDPASTARLMQTLVIDANTPTIKYYVNSANLGMFGNWNRGLELAEGSWVTLLHDDDWLYADYLKTMSLALDARYDVLACATGIGERDYVAGERGAGASVLANAITVNRLILGNISPAPGILIRKSLLLDMGGFDEAFYPCADYYTYVRCALNGRGLLLRDTLAYYRTSDSQTFKGDTLARMVVMSAAIKQQLLALAGQGIGARLTYILSMASWCRLGRLKSPTPVMLERTGLNRLAEHLSRTGIALNCILKCNSLYARLTSTRLQSSPPARLT